jgi:hypothetical protein
MEDPEPMVREPLISEIKPVVRQRKATLLQSLVGALNPPAAPVRTCTSWPRSTSRSTTRLKTGLDLVLIR